jgi:heat shock protein HslJ
MTFFGLFVRLAVLASLAASCSDSAAPTTPCSAALAGTWNLVSMQPAGQPEQATPSGASYTVTFDNGRLSVRADCNTCSSTFTFSGQTLTTGPALACTRAACRTMVFENLYTQVLSGEARVMLSCEVLTLLSPRGVLRFAR